MALTSAKIKHHKYTSVIKWNEMNVFKIEINNTEDINEVERTNGLCTTEDNLEKATACAAKI